MFAILKARFRCGSFTNLTLPHTATRWLILQKARRHIVKMLRLLVGARFQVLFHSPLGVLFTFPSRYWFTIGHRRVFSLGGWSPQLRTRFHVPGATRDMRIAVRAALRTGLITLCRRPSQVVPLPAEFVTAPVLQGSQTRIPTTPMQQHPCAVTHT